MEEKLYRSRKRRVIGGVAAGLGEYFNLDPILVRVILIIISLINGIGIILYIILWIIIPEEPWEMAYDFGNKGATATGSVKDKSDDSKNPETNTADVNFEDLNTKTDQKKSNTGRTVFGIILIGAGLLFLVDNIFPYFDFEDFLPLALIAGGIALIINSIRK